MKYIPNAMKFEQVKLKYDILKLRSWLEIKISDRFGLKTAMCSNFNEIWDLITINLILGSI